MNCADRSGSCRRILIKYFEGQTRRRKTLDFDADPHNDPDAGIFKGILLLREICKKSVLIHCSKSHYAAQNFIKGNANYATSCSF